MVIHGLSSASWSARPVASVAAQPGDAFAGTAPRVEKPPLPPSSPAWTLLGLAHPKDAERLRQNPQWESLPPQRIALEVLNWSNSRQVLQAVGCQLGLELIDQREKDAEGNQHLALRADRERAAIARAVLEHGSSPTLGARVLEQLEDPTLGLVQRLLEHTGEVPARATVEQLEVSHQPAWIGLQQAAMTAPDCRDVKELIGLALPRCGSLDGVRLGRLALEDHPLAHRIEQALSGIRAGLTSQEAKDWAERCLYVALVPMRNGTEAEFLTAGLPVVARSPEVLADWLPHTPLNPLLGDWAPRLKDARTRMRLVKSALEQPPEQPHRFWASAARGGGPDGAVLSQAWGACLRQAAGEAKDYAALGELAKESWSCPVEGARAMVERAMELSTGPLVPAMEEQLRQLDSSHPDVDQALAFLKSLAEEHAQLARQPGSGAVALEETHVRVGGVRLGRK